MKRIAAILMCLAVLVSFACAEGNTFLLTAPSGAPAIAVAKLAENDPEKSRLNS